MQAGAADYLLKPFSFETLGSTVKRVLGSIEGSGDHRHSKQDTTAQPTIKTLVTQDPKFCSFMTDCNLAEWTVDLAAWCGPALERASADLLGDPSRWLARRDAATSPFAARFDAFLERCWALVG